MDLQFVLDRCEVAQRTVEPLVVVEDFDERDDRPADLGEPGDIRANHVTSERGVEPLATLARYRRIERGVLFGQNLVQAASGRIAIGDELSVRAYVDPPAFQGATPAGELAGADQKG